MRRTIAGFTLMLSCMALLTYLDDAPNAHSAPRRVSSKPRERDAILYWNQIALQAVVDDHSGTFGQPEQGGPTRSSRALAIIHIAMYDAVNAIDGSSTPYIPVLGSTEGVSMQAAVAQSAHDTLVALYPNQTEAIDSELKRDLRRISNRRGRNKGIKVGAEAAINILAERAADGSAEGDIPIYPETSDPPFPGQHVPDPINPDQGYLTPGWGKVNTFSGINVSDDDVRTPPPPNLTDAAYASAFADVDFLGGDGFTTPTERTPEETVIGIFWAYDGSTGVGVPQVLYNQIVRKIAKQQRNTVVENARLFALVNIAMGDAGIASFDSKYFYNLWRPIVAIRNADLDGNPMTQSVENWTPLGAPASNQSGNDFTPPFPSYPSGHATFGAAMFRTLANFYGTDDICYRVGSDEFNGQTTDSEGNVRPVVVREFDSFSDGALENARARIYLGIHWQFDADAGIEQGITVADYVCDELLTPAVDKPRRRLKIRASGF